MGTTKGKTAVFVSEDELSKEGVARLGRSRELILLSLVPVSWRHLPAYQIDLAKLENITEIIKRENVTEIAFLGKVPHQTVFTLKQNSAGWQFLQALTNYQGETLLKGISNWLEKQGVTILSLSEIFLNSLATRGLISGPEPTSGEMIDLEFGKKVLEALLPFCIGQSVSVKQQTVVAVEAMEGTDEMIKRSGQLCQGFVVVKMAGQNKDVRFDLPAVGPETIRNLAAAGGQGIAVKAGQTIIVNQARMKALCQETGIFLFGF
ncbi:MAG: LpxI family protein [Candidatus Omnitrophica bacterium]|nr:LpxI family protein [Candidatus Omnitrophota bacterium]